MTSDERRLVVKLLTEAHGKLDFIAAQFNQVLTQITRASELLAGQTQTQKGARIDSSVSRQQLGRPRKPGNAEGGGCEC